MQYYSETVVTYNLPKSNNTFINKSKYRNKRKRYLITVGNSQASYQKSFYLFVTSFELREIIKEYLNNNFTILHISNI